MIFPGESNFQRLGSLLAGGVSIMRTGSLPPSHSAPPPPPPPLVSPQRSLPSPDVWEARWERFTSHGRKLSGAEVVIGTAVLALTAYHVGSGLQSILSMDSEAEDYQRDLFRKRWALDESDEVLAYRGTLKRFSLEESTSTERKLPPPPPESSPYTSTSDPALLLQGGAGILAGAATQNLLGRLSPSWGMGPIGKVAVSASVGLSVLGALRGVDTLGKITSSLGDKLSAMTTRNPYAGLQTQEGVPILPSDLGGKLGGTRLTAGGIRTLDGSGESSNGSLSLMALLLGAGIGVGTTMALDKVSLSIAKEGVYRVGESVSLSTGKTLPGGEPLVLPSGELAYKRSWKGVYASVVESKMRSGPSMGKNFTALVLGGAAGAAMGGLEGALVGAGLGSYVGSFLLSKEELGPQLGKKLGAAVVGATILSMLTRPGKDGGNIYSVTPEGTAMVAGDGTDIPYDVYRHPRGYELLGGAHEASPSIALSNEDVSRGSVLYKELFTPARLGGTEGVVTSKQGTLHLPGGVKVPNASGYRDIPVSQLPRQELPSPNALTNPLYASAQVGLFYLPMALLTAYGASRVYESGVGGNILKALGRGTSNYMDKVRYLWPGQTLQKEGMQRAVTGMAKGETPLLREGAAQLLEGTLMSTRGSLSSNIKKASLYAIPLSLAANYFLGQGIEADRKMGADYSKRSASSHWEGVPRVVPDGRALSPEVAKALDAQRYMAEGAVTRLPDSIFYDSASVGKGFRDFLSSAPDDSVKVALYSMGKQPELLRVMSRVLQDEGAIISGGSPLHFNAMESLKGILESLSYHGETMKREGIGAGIASLMSPLAETINSTAHLVGVASPFKEKSALLAQGIDPNAYRDPLAMTVNVGLYAGMGTLLGGFLPLPKPLGRTVGALIGAGIGLQARTYSDDTGWKKTGQEFKNTANSFLAYSDHVRLTGADPFMDSAYVLLGAPTLGAVVGTGIGYQFGRPVRGAALGAGTALLGATLTSLLRTGSPLPRLSDFGVSGVVTKDKMVSVLTKEKYEQGKQGLTHIHSKALWTKDEVFISTGNTATLWENAEGDETQFNIGIRIRGEQGKRIASQLDKVHAFLRKVTPDSDLSALQAQTPDLVLGGKGSQSKEKILSFLSEAKGDVWISAPYVSMSKDSRPIIDALKNLASSGHTVRMLSQNPDGVMGGGKEELSEAVIAELMAAGVNVYMTPRGSQTLEHAKILADEEKVLITSHNLLSGNSINKVIEVGTILHGKEYSQAVEDAIRRRILRVGAVELGSRPDLNESIYARAKNIKDMESSGLSVFLPGGEAADGLLAPTHLGYSYFYARALHNNLMRQAGQLDKVITAEDSNVASALYAEGLLAVGRPYSPPGGWVRQYDRELTTAGLGAKLNEAFIPLGIGRVYKDEVGLIPSTFGFFGSLLDKGWLSTYRAMGGTPEDQYDSITSKDRNRFAGGGGGFFESAFSHLTNVLVSSASAVAFYLLVSEPMGVLTAESLASHTVESLNRGLTKEGFKTGRTGALSYLERAYSTGMGMSSPSVEGYRLELALATQQAQRGKTMQVEAVRLAREELDVATSALLNRQQATSGPLIVTERRRLEAAIEAAQENLALANADLREVTRRGDGSFYGVSNFSVSTYHINAALRKRSQYLVENVMLPFLTNVVNPYKVGTAANSQFRALSIELSEQIGRPPELVFQHQLEGRGNLSPTEVTEFETRLREANVLVGRGESGLKAFDGAEALLEKASAYDIKNIGLERSSSYSLALQRVIEHVPLNPLHWGIFQRMKDGYGAGFTSEREFYKLGDVLSWHEITESIHRSLFGQAGVREHLIRHSSAALQEGGGMDLKTPFRGMASTFVSLISLARESFKQTASHAAIARRVDRTHNAFALMEQTLLPTGGIRMASETAEAWADMETARELPKRLDTLAQQRGVSVSSISPEEKALLQETLRRQFIGESSVPFMKEVTNLHDETVLKAFTAEGYLSRGEREAMDESGMLYYRNIDHGHTYAEELRLNSLLRRGDKAARALSKMAPGWGTHPTLSTTKRKLGSLGVASLVLGVLVGDRLFESSGGVSYFTSLATSITMGELPTNVSYGNQRLLPGGSDWMLYGGLFVAAAIKAKADSRYALEEVGFTMETYMKSRPAGSPFVDAEDLLQAAHTTGVIHPDFVDAEGKVGGVRYDARSGLYDLDMFDEAGQVKGTISRMAKRGDYLYRLAPIAVGDHVRRTFTYWGASILMLGGATMALSSLTTATRQMTYGVRGDYGTLDPLLGTLSGALIGTALGGLLGRGRALGYGAKGAVAGLGLGLITGLMTPGLVKVGKPGAVVSHDGTSKMELELFTNAVRERARDGKATRAELMAAYYAQGLAGTIPLVRGESGGKGASVSAKQVTFPFLQFFLSDTTKGAAYAPDGKVINAGTRYFSYGIQGPPVTGFSLVINAPLKIYTKESGAMGLAVNEESDFLDLLGQTAGVIGGLYGFLAVSSAAGYLSGVSYSAAKYGAGQALHKLRPSYQAAPYVMETLPRLGVANIASKVAEAAVEATAHLGSVGTRLAYSMFSVDYKLLSQLSRTGNLRGLAGIGLRSFAWATMLSSMGGAIAGASALATDEEDPSARMAIGQTVGAIAGVGVVVAPLFLPSHLSSPFGELMNKGWSHNAFGSSTFGRFMSRSAKAAIPLIPLALLATDSAAGISIGMDNDPLQRAITVGLTSLVGGAIYGGLADMGVSAGDTIEQYLRVSGEYEARAAGKEYKAGLSVADMPDLPGWKQNKNNPINALSEWYLAQRAAALEAGVESILGRARSRSGVAQLAYGGGQVRAVSVPSGGTTYGTFMEELSPYANAHAKDLRGISLDVLEPLIKKGRGASVSLGMLGSVLDSRRMVVGTAIAVAMGTAFKVLATYGGDQSKRLSEFYRAADASDKSHIRAFADSIRLFTQTDVAVDQSQPLMQSYETIASQGGLPIMMQNRKLVSARKDSNLGRTYQDLAEIMVLDDPNVFISLFNIGGATARKHEYGTRASWYAQLQMPGSDISAATYSMARTYFFKFALKGVYEQGLITTSALKEFHEATKRGLPLSDGVMRRTAAAVLSVTSALMPLTIPRKFSRPSLSTARIASKDVLLSDVLSMRARDLSTLALQPEGSLFSRLTYRATSGMGKTNAETLWMAALGWMDKGAQSQATKSLFADPYAIDNELLIDTLRIFKGRQSHTTGGDKTSPEGGVESVLESDYISPDTMRKSAQGGMNLLAQVIPDMPGALGIIGAVGIGAYLGGLALTAVGGMLMKKELSAMEESVWKFYGKAEDSWFPLREISQGPLKGEKRGPFEIKPLRDAHGWSFRELGNEKLVLFKGNYVFNLDAAVTKETIDAAKAASGSTAAFRQGVATLQENLGAALSRGGMSLAEQYLSAPGEVSPRLTAIVDRIKSLEGQAATVGRPGSVWFKSLVGTKEVITVSRTAFISQLTESLSLPLREASDEFFHALAAADLGTTQPGALLRMVSGSREAGTAAEMLDDFSLRMLSREGVEASMYGVLNTDGSLKLNVAGAFQNRIESAVSSVLEREIVRPGMFSGGSDLLTLDRFLLTGGGDMDAIIRQLAVKVLHELQQEGGLMWELRHTMGGVLQPLPLKAYEKVLMSVGEAVRGLGVREAPLDPRTRRPALGTISAQRTTLSGSAAQEAAIAKSMGRTKPTVMQSLQKGVKGAFDLLGVAWDTLEAIDMAGATGRAAKAYGPDSEYSLGERKRLANEMSNTIVTSLAFSFLLSRVGGMVMHHGMAAMNAVRMGGTAMRLMSTGAIGLAALATLGMVDQFGNGGRARKWAMETEAGKRTVGGISGATLGYAIGGGIGAAAGGFLGTLIPIPGVGTALGISSGALIGAALGASVGAFGDKMMEAATPAFNALGTAFNWLTDRVGDGIDAVGSSLGSFGVWVVGGLAIGLSVAATVATFGGFALFSGAGLAILGQGLFAGGMTGGALGALSQMGLAGPIEWLFSSVSNWFNKLGLPFNPTSQEGDWIRYRYGELQGQTPFYVGTAKQAMEAEYKKAVDASRDYSGAQTAANLTHATHYGGGGTSRLANLPGFSVRPDSFIDPYLQDELRIRGQIYNTTVMGRSFWQAMLADALNRGDILREMSPEAKRARAAVEEAHKISRSLPPQKERVSPFAGVSMREQGSIQSIVAAILPAFSRHLEESSQVKVVTAKATFKPPSNPTLSVAAHSYPGGSPTDYNPVHTTVSAEGSSVYVKSGAKTQGGYRNHDVRIELAPAMPTIA